MIVATQFRGFSSLTGNFVERWKKIINKRALTLDTDEAKRQFSGDSIQLAGVKRVL